MAEKKTYWQLLRDPRWQRKRLEIMQRADFKCESCDAANDTLNVHHKYYRKGAKPWEYEEHELACLCEACHQNVHDWRERLDIALAMGADIEAVVGFAEASALVDEIFEEDEDGNQKQFVWQAKTYEHAFGLICALSHRPSQEEVWALLEACPLYPSDIFALGPYKTPVSELRKENKES